jgi:hypothetical protein
MYGEACTALPLNGGAYNVLLNTTSKIVASLAACLTILSYTATAVVSASESVCVVTYCHCCGCLLSPTATVAVACCHLLPLLRLLVVTYCHCCGCFCRLKRLPRSYYITAFTGDINIMLWAIAQLGGGRVPSCAS